MSIVGLSLRPAIVAFAGASFILLGIGSFYGVPPAVEQVVHSVSLILSSAPSVSSLVLFPLRKQTPIFVSSIPLKTLFIPFFSYLSSFQSRSQ